MSPEERAREGVFLAFQYPVEIPGVSNVYFLKAALNAIRKHRGQPELDAMDFLALVKEKAKVVDIDEALVKRPVNEGFSGGEKKRNEIFQMAILDPALAILDETDSGLDIDALRMVAAGVNQLRSPQRAMILVTHYQRLLNYIVPDFVHVLLDGRIVKSGGKELALELESKGYEWLEDGGPGAMTQALAQAAAGRGPRFRLAGFPGRPSRGRAGVAGRAAPRRRWRASPSWASPASATRTGGRRPSAPSPARAFRRPGRGRRGRRGRAGPAHLRPRLRRPPDRVRERPLRARAVVAGGAGRRAHREPGRACWTASRRWSSATWATGPEGRQRLRRPEHRLPRGRRGGARSPPASSCAEPIHLVHHSTGERRARRSPIRGCSWSRGATSQATIVESYGGPDGQAYLTNAVTEIVLEDGAIVDHYKVQREGAGRLPRRHPRRDARAATRASRRTRSPWAAPSRARTSTRSSPARAASAR